MHLSTHIIGLAVLGSVDVVTAACTSGTWVNLTSIPNPRQEHGTAALGNSTIAVLGGILGGETTDLFQLYDIASGTWSNATAAPYKVNHPNTAAIGSTLYLLGGLTDGPTSAGSINWVAAKESYAYDLATDSWTELSPMPNGTEKGSAVTGVYGDIIYLAGGMTTLTSSQDAVDSVISYNTTSDEWIRLDAGPAELPQSRQHATGGIIGDTLYVVGGRRYSQTNVFDTVFELDLTNSTAEWQTSTGHLPVARGGLSGGAVGTQFYAFGGEGDPDTTTGVYPQSDVFDTESQNWTALANMQVPRHGTQAAVVDGLIYIPGGGLQQDGKNVTVDGVSTTEDPTNFFDAYCA